MGIQSSVSSCLLPSTQPKVYLLAVDKESGTKLSMLAAKFGHSSRFETEEFDHYRACRRDLEVIYFSGHTRTRENIQRELIFKRPNGLSVY
jgi:hypothetical protein